MYVLSNGHSYIGVNDENIATSVSNVKKALSFSEEKKASNYRDNLKSTLRKFNWQIVKIEEDIETDRVENEECDTYTYVETQLEESGFNVSEFFNNAVTTISQLRDYANNMNFLE